MRDKEKTAVSNLLRNMLELPERYSNDFRQTEFKATEESIKTELLTESKHVTDCKRGKTCNQFNSWLKLLLPLIG